MEMQNSALTQMMATQTNILEEIRELRRKEDMRNQFASIAPSTLPSGVAPSMNTEAPVGNMSIAGAPMQGPASQINMFQPQNHYDTTTPAPSMNTLPNPLSYQSVSSIPMVGGVAGMAHDTITDSVNFDRSRMSKEATSEFFAQRSQGFQMGAVETTGKAIEGVGTASGFLVGGLLGGMAVGTIAGVGAAYVADSMTSGARNALNYQDILRRDGYKAFNALESTTEFGGIGMNLDDQQDISSFLRDLSTENYMDDAEMSQLLQGSLDNKLLKGVTDVKSFKDKMSNLVNSVKEISLTLNQTMDEAIEMMGEMERRGVTSDRQTGIAASGKVAASFLGTDATQYMQQMMSQTDSIVAGTSMNAANVMEGIGFNSYLATAIESVSSDGDGVLKQYIKNRGGAGSVAGEMESSMRSYFQSAGQNQLVGLFGAAFEQDENGNFSLNQSRLNEMINSGMDYRQLSDMSREYTRSLSNTDQVKLASSAGQIFNQNARSEDLFGALGYLQRQYQDVNGMDAESSLVSMGLTNDFMDARVLNEAIIGGTNADTVNQFSALAVKEKWDSARNADSPGLGKRIKYGFNEMFTNPLGDMGQYISDGVGDITQDIQMFTSGIEENQRVGGDVLREINPETFEEMFTGEGSNNARLQEVLNELDPNRNVESAITASNEKKKDMSYSDFKRLVKDIKDGKMSGSDLASLRAELDSGVYNRDTEQQIRYALNLASGEYDGVGGMFKRVGDYSTAVFEGSSSPNKAGKGQVNSLEEIERQESDLKENIKSASEELTKLMASGADLGVSADRYDELEESIRSGDVSAVRNMTSNSDVLDMANKFQGYVEERDKIGEASEWYKEDFRTAQGAIEISAGIYDFIKASGVYSEEEFSSKYDTFFGSDKKDLTKRVKKARKKLASMSDQEVYETAQGFMEESQGVLEQMSQTELKRLAESYVADMPSVNIETLYAEGSNKIDAAKLYKSYADTSRLQQAGSSAAEDSIIDSKEVSKTTEEHMEAMNTMLATFLTETGKMQEAIEDLKTKNYSKYTGIQ